MPPACVVKGEVGKFFNVRDAISPNFRFMGSEEFLLNFVRLRACVATSGNLIKRKRL